MKDVGIKVEAEGIYVFSELISGYMYNFAWCWWCPNKMAVWWSLRTCLWLCLVISQISWISAYYEIPQTSNMEMLFAPCTLVEGSCLCFALCLWRHSSHLRPFLQHQSRMSWTTVIPSCYWLLLLTGDAELNPDPEHCSLRSWITWSLTNDLVISHLNVRNLQPKKDGVQLFLQQHTCSRAWTEETWLNDSVPTGELSVVVFEHIGETGVVGEVVSWFMHKDKYKATRLGDLDHN